MPEAEKQRDAATGLPVCAPGGKVLPGMTLRRPNSLVTGRRDALAVLDKFLHAGTTRKRLLEVFGEWLEKAPHDFVTKVLIPLMPKALVEEGVEAEKRESGVIQIITNVPRPERGEARLTISVGEPMETVDTDGEVR